MDHSVRKLEKIIFDQTRYRSALEEKWGKRYLNYREKWSAASNLKLMTDFPIHLDLDTVDACNLNCKFCSQEHNFQRKRTYKRISDDLLKSIFNEVKGGQQNDSLCALNVGTLGEPFIYPETTFKILEYARDAKVMETFIHTNAQLLNLNLFKQLIELDLTYLLISIDAITPETYKEMRGDDFNKVMKIIMELIEYKRKKELLFPVMRVSFVETDNNRGEKADFIEYWKDKVNFIDIQPCCDYTNMEIVKNTEITYSCQMPFQRMQIGVEGQIGLCCDGYIMRPDFMIGRFPEISMYEAWNSATAGDLRCAHINRNFDGFDACLECLCVVQNALERMDK